MSDLLGARRRRNPVAHISPRVLPTSFPRFPLRYEGVGVGQAPATVERTGERGARRARGRAGLKRPKGGGNSSRECWRHRRCWRLVRCASMPRGDRSVAPPSHGVRRLAVRREDSMPRRPEGEDAGDSFECVGDGGGQVPGQPVSVAATPTAKRPGP